MASTISLAKLCEMMDDCYVKSKQGENVEIPYVVTKKGEKITGDVKFGFPQLSRPDGNLPVALIMRKQVDFQNIQEIKIGDVEYEIVEE
ncbi:MAG: hypothetical protein J6K78_04980 [Tidjanibacter sp.]|nr:hypothetical protein [Tidjanibacter sp.]